MTYHNCEIGAMAFFSPLSDFRDLVLKIAAHKPDPKVYGVNDVQVLDCVVLLGHGDIVCRLHAPRLAEDQKGGAERIADWVNSVINANGIKEHIRDSHTYIVGYETTAEGFHRTAAKS